MRRLLWGNKEKLRGVDKAYYARVRGSGGYQPGKARGESGNVCTHRERSLAIVGFLEVFYHIPGEFSTGNEVAASPQKGS